MQHLSYNFRDPFVRLGPWEIAVRVATYENVYGLDPDRLTVIETSTGRSVVAEGLMWAGNQMKAPGRVTADLTFDGQTATVRLAAALPRTVRGVKLLITGLGPGTLTTPFGTTYRLPAQPVRLAYPSIELSTPLVFYQEESGRVFYARSLDSRVRRKRITLYQGTPAMESDRLFLELDFEDLGPEQSDRVTVPAWEFGYATDPEAVRQTHQRHVEASYGLQPWEERADVPDWARDIALVVALHGMHWTGYVFNTYAQMAAALETICQAVPGRHVLAFLPGWEGRYYWDYGTYRPDPRLGGPEGFRQLVARAAALGVVLMPMFGANCANKGLENYEQWGAPAEIVSVGGFVFQGNRPDWDAFRAQDHGWQAWLNPGAPTWRQRLLQEIGQVVETYGLRAIFLDTHHVWENDARYDLYAGLLRLREELRARHPGLLVTGEGWYDALGAVTPIVHAGFPEAWPDLLGRYCRIFGHLRWGDPSRGSSGVHEQGYVPFQLAPDHPAWLPTLTVVDGTLERAPEKVQRVLTQARRRLGLDRT